MLSLVSKGLPPVPDSLVFPEGVFPELQRGDQVELNESIVVFPGECFPVQPDQSWSGRVVQFLGPPDKQAFLTLTEHLPNGFLHLPEKARQRAVEALQREEWEGCLGLGCGLTPSFDDACVGWMAYRQAQGKSFPELKDLSMTTDVSARYLRLAKEGYFGDLLLDLLQAIFQGKALEETISRLAKVGATSGCDMMEGIRLSMLREP